ncbi:hypothetical protein [Streptomyces sp. NPDC051183]|uniref:hypothetical protein n=1 Tax=Streptomyces sp. NPDC051183 TaxID=3155165 RepID=UPI0034162CED
MQDAVYSLLGALGGAAFAGAAAYWGPLRAQKAARQEAERQREQAQSEAEEARTHERRSSQVARVALIRRVVGNWCYLLDVTLDKVQNGQAVDDFWESARQSRDVVTTAVYDGVRDGFAISATRRSQSRVLHSPRQPWGPTAGLPVQQPEGTLPRTRVGDHTIAVNESERQLILDALDRATARVGALVGLAPSDSGYPEALESAQQAVDEAGQARADLSVHLMQRLMAVTDLDFIDPRRAPGTSP